MELPHAKRPKNCRIPWEARFSYRAEHRITWLGVLPILWESVATLVNPENPIILEILIQTITKIPKRVKISAEYRFHNNLSIFR